MTEEEKALVLDCCVFTYIQGFKTAIEVLQDSVPTVEQIKKIVLKDLERDLGH